jgi:HEAT repeat protein
MAKNIMIDRKVFTVDEDDEGVLNELFSRLKYNSNPAERLFAAMNLGILGNRKAVAPLTNALKDRNVNVRFAVISALNQVGGNPATIKFYLGALFDKESFHMRKEAAIGIGMIGGKDAISQLQKAILKEDSYKDTDKESHDKVKEAAQDAINMILARE